MPPPLAPDHSALIGELVAQGITSKDLSRLTGRALADVESALGTLTPVRGQQSRSRVYDLWQALGALGRKSDGEEDAAALEEAIMRMKPTQLPAALSLEFWKAQKARSDFMEERGDLWRTPKVQALVASVYKVLRQSMSLLEDNVDQQTALTPRQREIIRSIADATLAEAAEAIQDKLKGWEGIDDHDDGAVQ
jgi:hypothetical protein